MLAPQRQQRVERRLDGIADGKRLDRGFVHIEAAPEVGDHFFGPRLGRERLDHVVLAVEDVGDAGKARLHHQRGADTIARAHAAEVERLLDVFGVARPAPDARHLLRRVRQRVAHAALVEPRQRRGGPHGTERRAGALCASMRGADMVGPERHQKPAAEVIAEDDGLEHFGARSAFALADREGGGHDGTAWMRLRDRLEVVGFIGVREHAVGERRVHRRRPDLRRQDRGFLFAALRLDVADRGLARREVRAGDDRAERIQDAVPGFARGVGGEGAIARLDHVARQPRGHRSSSAGHRLSRRSRWRRRTRSAKPKARRPRRSLHLRSSTAVAASCGHRFSKPWAYGLGMSTAIHTAGTLPVFSPQWVVARPSAKPSPGLATTSGFPSWWYVIWPCSM